MVRDLWPMLSFPTASSSFQKKLEDGWMEVVEDDYIPNKAWERASLGGNK